MPSIPLITTLELIVFIKFLNCVSGYVYLAVNTQNYRAINFYNNILLTVQNIDGYRFAKFFGGS